MITAYAKYDSQVVVTRLAVGDPIPNGTVWVDLLHPTEAERLFVLGALGVDLPDEAEMEDIEASSRLYVEGQTVFLTTNVTVGAETAEPEVGELTFALTPNYLVTTRYVEPRALDIFAFRVRKSPEFLNSSTDALLEMCDSILDRMADIIQAISLQVDTLSESVFHHRPMTQASAGEKGKRRKDKSRNAQLTQMLEGIGHNGNLTHKIRDCLNGVNRMFAFVGVQMLSRYTPEQAGRLKTLNRDVQSLLEATNAMSNEISFLLDATLGFINIEQNNIIKIFSIAAVVFLPPTLVGTIYGMNFNHMPELQEIWGYPVALTLMLVSAILPVWFFRRRGWL